VRQTPAPRLATARTHPTRSIQQPLLGPVDAGGGQRSQGTLADHKLTAAVRANGSQILWQSNQGTLADHKLTAGVRANGSQILFFRSALIL
jgi:hypothetical protein